MNSIILILAFCFLSFAARAEDRFSHSHWIASCKTKHASVLFTFISKSRNADDDDMTVEVKFGAKKVLLDIKPALFADLRISGFKSSCDRLTGLEKDNNLLVFFRKDDRPGADRLVAVLLDLKNSKVLAVDADLGALKDIQIEDKKDGVRVKLSQGWKMKSTSDGPENLLAGWKTISVKNGKIESKWEKPLPETHKAY